MACLTGTVPPCPVPMPKRQKPPSKLVDVHAKLFEEDVAQLKQLADAKGSKYLIELRQLVRRALRGERQEFIILREQP